MNWLRERSLNFEEFKSMLKASFYIDPELEVLLEGLRDERLITV